MADQSLADEPVDEPPAGSETARQGLIAACGAAFALAVAVGVGVWQATAHHATAARPGPAQDSPRAPADAPAAAHAPGTPRPVFDHRTIYIVGSEEQARFLQQSMAPDASSTASGGQEEHIEVYVAGPDDDERVYQIYLTAFALSGLVGGHAGETRVYDLRAH